MQINHPENLIGANGATANGDHPHLVFEPLDGLHEDDIIEEDSSENAPFGRKHLISIHIFVASLLIGVVGNFFFYNNSPGINLPLFVLVFIITAFVLIRLLEVSAYAINLSLLVPALIFSVCISLIASPMLMIVNLALVLGALGFALRFSGMPRFLGGSLGSALEHGMDMLFVSWVRDPLNTLTQSYSFLKHSDTHHRRFRHFCAHYFGSIVRGALLTLPVIIVFGILLSSADAIFADVMDNVVAWFSPKTPWNTIWQMFFIGVIAWFSMVGFRLMFTDPISVPAERESEKRKPFFPLTMIEAGMMLGAVNLLFIVFMLIQARYLFGGDANINAQGLTYAQYARRGFQELLTVSCLTTVLTLLLDTLTVRDRQHDRLFKSLVTTMIGLTALLLVAAFYRLYLYQDAYGYTRIRVSSGVFMLWLALLFGFLLWDIWRAGETRNGRVFWIGCIVVLFGFVLSLNVLNMDRFIASQNIARWEHGESLDVTYLTSLSDDVIPVVAPLLDNTELTTAQRETLLTQLGYRLYALDNWHDERGLFSYHFGLENAWRALDAHRETLAGYVVQRPYGYRGAWD